MVSFCVGLDGIVSVNVSSFQIFMRQSFSPSSLAGCTWLELNEQFYYHRPIDLLVLSLLCRVFVFILKKQVGISAYAK